MCERDDVLRPPGACLVVPAILGVNLVASVDSSREPIPVTKWDLLENGCQMAIARLLDCMHLALRASGLWLRYATLQILPSGNLDSSHKWDLVQNRVEDPSVSN